MTTLPRFDANAGSVLLPSHTRTAPPVPNSLRRTRWRPAGLFGVAGLSGLAALVARQGPGEVLAVCRSAGLGVAWIVAAPAVGIFLHTLAWRALLPPPARPSTAASYRLFIAAQAGNELGFGVLGEPFKVLGLEPGHREVGVSVVALDNLTAAIALVAFYGALGAAVGAADPAGRGHVGAGVILGAALVAAVVLGASERARRIARASLALLTERPFHAILAVFLHLLGKLWLVAEMALAAAVLGSATLHGSVVLALASATASAIGAPVPGQLGIVEGALVAVASSAGLTPSAALAVGLLRRLRSTLWLAAGAAFALPLLRASSNSSQAPRTPCTNSP